MRTVLRGLMFSGLAGIVGCGGSCGTSDGPVPGGFPEARRITRAAEVRLTRGGLDGLAQALSAEATSGLGLACNVASDCPTGFVDAAGAPIAAGCAGGVCQEAGARGPYVAVPLPASPTGLEICPTGGASCAANMRLAGFSLVPRAGAGLRAMLDLQLVADVSVRAGDADCVVSLRPAAAPQPVAVDVDLGVHSSGAITVGVAGVQLGLPPGAVSVAVDPALGDANDVALCTQLDPGPTLLSALEAQLGPMVQGLLTGAFGLQCGTSADCPAQAQCDVASGLCVDLISGDTLGASLGYETRLQLPALLGELGYRGTSGVVDTAVAVGGSADADAEGISLGVLGGLEAPYPNPTCATVTPSPVSRPGFVAPAGLPASGQADLDWDGAPETSYDVAFGASQALLQQVAWGIYTSGLFCGLITHADFDGLTTGALELIIPSVRFLARSHLFPRSEAPARLSVYMRAEPAIVIGSGEVTVRDGEGTWTEPLARLDLDDVEINLSVLVDERYVRVLTVTLDLHIGLGALVTPNNGIEPVLGVGVANLVSDVRVTNSELLSEPPSSLAASIPTLVSLIVLDLAGSQGEIALPSLPGLDVTVLGLRGEPATGPKDTIAVYASAQPATQGNLLSAVDTRLLVDAVQTPETAAFAVTHEGGPEAPVVHLALAAEAAQGAQVEYQVRVDGGPWGPFFRAPQRALRHPAFLLQGRHSVQARARAVGDYKTLDPTPAEIEVVIDSVAPALDVTIEGTALEIDAWDRVGPVHVALVTEAGRREIAAGRVEVPELREQGALSVEAVDGAGNVTRRVLRAASEAAQPSTEASTGGCTSTGSSGGASFFALLAGLGVCRRRRGR